MKKLLALLLAITMMFALAACGGEDNSEDSSDVEFSNDVSDDSSDDVSDESSDDVSDKGSDDASDEGSDDSSDDTSEDGGEQTAPEFIANFVSIGTVDTKVKADSANSVKLTGIDTDLSYGAIVLYTTEYGRIPQQALTDFVVVEFTYSGEQFGYVKTNLYAAGEAPALDAPKDGFLIALHSSQTEFINKLTEMSEIETVFPHGIHLYTGADYTVKKAETAPVIDGIFSEEEWENYFVDDVNATNPDWSYAQFEVGNYYSTGKYYTAYDDEYVYLCVVVESPNHYCPITPEKAGDMWQYECIQVKVSSEAPDGEYIATNFDYSTNKTAVTEGVVRSYGFAANDDNETCYYEGGYTSEFTGQAGCSRDDMAQLTVYEVAIPFEEFGLTAESGLKMGLTFSINSTSEEDVANKVWKNVTLRNGGGVIGRNDWSKIPVITLE